jgi:hypothetical protein
MLIWNALPAKNQLKLIDGHLLLNDLLTKIPSRSMGTEMSGI